MTTLGLRSTRQHLEIEPLAVWGDVHLDLVVPREFTHENLLAKRILDELLNRPITRPGTVLLVIAVLDEEVGRLIGQLERELFLGQALPHVLEQHADDLRDVLAAERIEDADRVQTVEELGFDRVLQPVPALLRPTLPVLLR